MIYGNLDEIKQYKGISKNLDSAINFIIEKKYLNANFGKNEIDGDKIYFNYPEEALTRDKKNLELEYHKKYIDIHIVVEGEESIGYTSIDKCCETFPYDKEKDFTLMSGELQNEFYLNKNKFLILFPFEPHLALLKVGIEKRIKKVIFKVEL